jgi:hypothetical protein
MTCSSNPTLPFVLSLADSVQRVFDFRAVIHSLTAVPPVRQKLIGLTKGKLSAELDSTRFGSLGVKDGGKFAMIGTPEQMSFKDPSEVKLPDVGLLPCPLSPGSKILMVSRMG